MVSESASRSTKLWTAVGWLVTAALALAPWWKNHEYIRDFFDYGMMMVAAGRINAGQLLYVDIATPLQSTSYLLNAWAERWFGGDFIAMTWGNALFIPAAIALLAFTLHRRIDPAAAMLLVFCMVVGSASQHSLIWYNAIGAITLAVVAWTTALHPVLTRASAGRAGLVAVMLVVNGMNKINFQALALAVACAWALRAALTGAATWRQAGSTIALWLVAGVALPLGLELQITGATFAQWKANVIGLPFSAPAYGIERFLNVDFLLRPVHDFYGPVIQPIGLILVIWAAITVGLAWPRRSAGDRTLLLSAAVMALGGTFALIATNHEIVYIGLVSGIALIVALWMGFGLWERTRLRTGLLIAPATVLAIFMFLAAWQGQRVLFGHDTLDRTVYRTFTPEDGDAYAYLVGTYMPPAIHESLLNLEEVIPAETAKGLVPVFYSSGAEFLERLWPNTQLEDMPLLIASLTVSEEWARQLPRHFGFPPQFEMLIGMTAWLGSWPVELARTAQLNAMDRWEVGRFTVNRFSREGLYSALPPGNDALQGLANFGGNMDPHQVTVDRPLWPFEFMHGDDQRVFLGTQIGHGRFTFRQNSFRIAGQIVMQRTEESDDRTVEARFRVIDTAIPEDTPGWVIWEAIRTLEPGRSSLTEDYLVDSRGRSVRFDVTVPESSHHAVQAGFFLPEIRHSGFHQPDPPILRHPAPAEKLDGDVVAAALLPEDWQDKFTVVVRGGSLSPTGNLRLFPGDELWLHTDEPINEILGKVSLTASRSESGSPVVRIIWYRSGRLQFLQQRSFDKSDDTMNFNMWPADAQGWYGILLDHNHSPHGLDVFIDQVRTGSGS